MSLSLLVVATVVLSPEDKLRVTSGNVSIIGYRVVLHRGNSSLVYAENNQLTAGRNTIFSSGTVAFLV